MSFLEASTPWQLLFATILSAQCTDARVNKVTDLLYRKYRSVQDFADCDLRELERDIHSIGFYHSKARNLKACAAVLLEKYGGRVPDQLEELTALPGVGRKTANLILGRVYGKAAIVVDTHVRRVSNRLGLAKSSDPNEPEPLPSLWLAVLAFAPCVVRREGRGFDTTFAQVLLAAIILTYPTFCGDC